MVFLRRWPPLVIILALSAAAPVPAWAQDAPRLPQACAAELIQRLRPVRPAAQALTVRTVVGSHCRRMPGDATRRVAAIVYGPPIARRFSEAAAQPLPLTLVLAVLPASGSAVLQRYEKTLEEDAGLQVAGSNFTWDPAVYRLAPDVLALGLRFRNSAPEASCPDQRTGNTLSLLIPDGSTLRPVFAAAMSAQVGLAGPLCRHAPAWEEHERTLRLAPSRPGEWADLLLVNRITVQRHDAAEGEKPLMRQVTMRWRYDGQRYRIPPDSPSFEALGDATVVSPAP